MRFSLLAAPLLALAACGGGGGTATTQSAALQGVVYEVNGQTVDRAGVTVRVLETGQVATTGADGRFFFSRVPADAFTLDFGGGLASLAASGPGGGGADDPPGDDNGSGGNGADDPLGDDNGVDLTEDDDGNPQVGGVSGGDTVEVLAAVDNGQVVEMSVVASDRVRAEARLTRDASSPDPDVQGKVRIESRVDREKFTIEAEHLDVGALVDFRLDGALIGTATADATGEAKLELNTKDGASLPLGATSAADLSGLPVAVSVSGGAVLLTGTVPALPDPSVTPGDPGSGGDSSRGRARLTALVAGIEGEIEIRQRLDTGEQRFKMEAEHLAPGTQVAFAIEDLANPGTYVKIQSVVAGSDGEAEINTEDGLPLPLGVSDISLLVGLGVRVTLDDGSGQVLLEGSVPALVAD